VEAAAEAMNTVKTKTIVHLVTQDDQPYGSERRSCENCGKWIIGNGANDDLHVDTKETWAQLKAKVFPDIEPCSLKFE